MTGVAIVAVPNNSDMVWDVSSEKIPHMTLLFLGDALAKEDYKHVQEFITHVADTMLRRFGMSVDKRGSLGDANADVLFFKNSDGSKISLFRKYLLQDTKIREAYESVDQFDGWTPHLTLGYPDTPAKKLTRENDEFYWVNFNRLMLWTGDYEGPEIELKDEDLEVVMSDQAVEFLAHHGVKGMRWGVRKSAEERRAERTLRVQEKAVKKIKKQEEFTARANAREAAAKAKTEAQDARAAAATAKLESKLARDQARFAKKEARSGRDDPINEIVTDKKGNPRDMEGLVGKTDRDASKQRINAMKDVRTLDDDTLRAYTQRLDTEKKLKNAINEDLKPGRTAAKKLIGDSGKEVAKKALVGVGSMAVFYGLSRMSKTHDFKPNPEGIGNLLSGAKGSSAAGAFNKTDKMAKLAGGLEIPMSEVAKWKKPASMGPRATPF